MSRRRGLHRIRRKSSRISGRVRHSAEAWSSGTTRMAHWCFRGGDTALKIKRAVHFAYMDFSSLVKRRAALEREFEVNRANAPEIYVGVEPVTREADGSLKLGGDGEAIEWALRMRRFPQSALLSRRLADGRDVAGLKDLADEVSRSHRDAPIARGAMAVASLEAVIAEITGELRGTADPQGGVGAFRDAALGLLSAVQPVIEKRAAAGKVRRCHGDLHLDNIVIIDGRPRLFDALEFDEALATVDTLYDLGFLLMDLDAHGYRGQANAVLNRYLWKSQDTLDLEGLAAMPLFLALRGGVRAMVAGQRAAAADGPARERSRCDAEHYLALALHYLKPRGQGLVAVGGLSGTGKSTLAAGLAPLLGPSPGGVHLRSDLERKALHGVDELTRLPDEAYSADASRRVYDVMADKARLVLGARHAVVVDAVFSSPAEREAFERLADACGVPFVGIWLEADGATLLERVEARKGDASDATGSVVRRQSARGVGAIAWTVIDAGGTVAEVQSMAMAIVRRAIPECSILR